LKGIADALLNLGYAACLFSEVNESGGSPLISGIDCQLSTDVPTPTLSFQPQHVPVVSWRTQRTMLCLLVT